MDYIIIARQAGTANAFAPLIRALQEQGRELLLLAFADACKAWNQEEIAPIAIDSFEQAEAVLQQHCQSKVMLTGSSFAALDDAGFWQWARRNKMVSIAFVDHWSNYAERFSSNPEQGKRFDLLPDRIAVIDQVAAKSLEAAGCPPEKITITGHPVFDGLMHDYAVVNHALRHEYLDKNSELLWLFISEPLSRIYGQEPSTNGLGFTEFTTLSDLLPTLDLIASRQAIVLTLLIKPHPVELQEDGLKKLISKANNFSNLCIKIVEDVQRYQLITACDLVLGMTSMLLYEAALIGKPVFSLQFNRQRGCDLTDNRDFIKLLTSPKQIPDKLRIYFDKEVGSRPPKQQGMALVCFMKLLQNCRYVEC